MKKNVTIVLVIAGILFSLLAFYFHYLMYYLKWLTGSYFLFIIVGLIILSIISSITFFRKLDDVRYPLVFLILFLLFELFALFSIFEICRYKKYSNFYPSGDYLFKLDESNKEIVNIYTKWGKPYLKKTGCDEIYTIDKKDGFSIVGIKHKDEERCYLYELDCEKNTAKEEFMSLSEYIEEIQNSPNIFIVTKYTYDLVKERDCEILKYFSDNSNDTFESIIDKTDNDNNAKDEYFEIGPIDCACISLRQDSVKEGDSKTVLMEPLGNAILYAKSFDGLRYYYVGIKGQNEKYPVTKYYELSDFNGKTIIDEIEYYLTISEWVVPNENHKEQNFQSQQNQETQQKETHQRVEVVHHHDPVPVQEWVPCYMCGGSGNCHLCNGTGRNLYSSDYRTCIACAGNRRCTSCAGQGGHYETRYR